MDFTVFVWAMLGAVALIGPVAAGHVVLAEWRKTAVYGVEQCDETLHLCQQLLREAKQTGAAPELVMDLRMQAMATGLHRDRYARTARRLGAGRYIPATDPVADIEREITS